MLKKKGFDYIICFTSLLTTALFPFTHASTTSIHERRTQPETYASFQDPMKQIVVQPRDVFEFTNQPSSLPSLYPSITANPTKTPSSMPSSSPTSQPTLNPSTSPSSLPSISNQPSLFPSISTRPSNVPSTSMIPSFAPSSSSEPSSVPSTQFIHAINPPKPSYYFSYNPRDLNHGPGKARLKNYTFSEVISSGPWTIVQNKTINYTEYEGNAWESVKHSLGRDYWSTFSLNRTLDNRCGSDPVRKQSPIDLCPSHVNYKCYEHHQIRNRGGDYNLTNEQVIMKILPSKLRIEYSRENAILNETMLRPPNGDFPHNWNGYIQVTHIDIKIPSEHTVCGKRYDGEYQIYFYHPLRRQPIVQSILIEVHPQNRSHLHFQKAIDEWQRLSDSRYLHCLNTTIDDDGSLPEQEDGENIEEERQWTHHIASRSRLLNEGNFTDGNISTIAPSMGPLSHSPSTTPTNSNKASTSPTLMAGLSNSPSFTNKPTPAAKQATTRTKIRWNPFEPRIVSSIYFYGYTGSLTEPPCSEWVHWRVLDTPMQISSEQLTQMKDILFQQLDEDCQPSSYGWEESVARPIQSLNERPLWQCTSSDYLSDEEKRSTDST